MILWLVSNFEGMGMYDIKLVGILILRPKGYPPKQNHPKLLVQVSEPSYQFMQGLWRDKFWVEGTNMKENKYATSHESADDGLYRPLNSYGLN